MDGMLIGRGIDALTRMCDDIESGDGGDYMYVRIPRREWTSEGGKLHVASTGHVEKTKAGAERFNRYVESDGHWISLDMGPSDRVAETEAPKPAPVAPPARVVTPQLPPPVPAELPAGRTARKSRKVAAVLAPVVSASDPLAGLPPEARAIVLQAMGALAAIVSKSKSA